VMTLSQMNLGSHSKILGCIAAIQKLATGPEKVLFLVRVVPKN